MSHFKVSIFTEKVPTVAELDYVLEPYDEQLEVEPYVYLTKEEAIERITNYLNKNPKAKETYKNLSYQEAVKDFFGKEVDEEGNVLSTYNPNSKWDWWSIGGRFGQQKSLDDKSLYTHKVSNIDWITCNSETLKRFWEVVVEDKEPKTEEEKKTKNFYNKDYFLELYKDKETFIKVNSYDLPMAFIDLNGTWYEQGSIGWFGSTNATNETILDFFNYFKKYVEGNPNAYVTVVDCHI